MPDTITAVYPASCVRADATVVARTIFGPRSAILACSPGAQHLTGSRYADQGDRRKSEQWADIRNGFSRLGIPARAIDSLALIPVVKTALDDGSITPDEERKLLSVMKMLGLLTSGIAPQLEKLWVPFKGRTPFLVVWTVYLRDLRRHMLPETADAFKSLITESCTFVIGTVGGFLKVVDLRNRLSVAIDNAFAYGLLSAERSDVRAASPGSHMSGVTA